MGIFQATDSQVFVSDTIVRDNAAEGIRMVTGNGSITLERVTIEGNATISGSFGPGIYVSPNVAFGRLEATITDSSFVRNGLHGIWADAGASSGVRASVDRSTITGNGSHGVLVTGSSSADLRVSVQRSTMGAQIGFGLEGKGDSSATIDVNASDNVALNAFNGGTGVTIRASGNSGAGLVCDSGCTIVTYQNNSVQSTGSGCLSPASLH